jgi:hypothetical protein
MLYLVIAESQKRAPSGASRHDADNPLHRTVAMAYRSAREAGHSHDHAVDAAEAVYFQALPEELTDRLGASARIDAMIASAINFDACWFWKNMRTLIDAM